ncbi:hypothetical protein MATL_G00045200 [Megalops atlanticus]|uniref:CCDC92/74 N-terminal domain-containing protein n=1 Tax=Megalops atlanticus TaxID=7932 RepID=A0A9D3QBR6_MEGAT|nr:hypothetical protein MATL_G00045200 [Megalops atlanticus]
METGPLARQVECVERNMAFLRQEHLSLLRGLHREILSLQRRCAELTCELNLKPPGRTQAEVEEEEQQLEARCREVEERLREQQCTLGELRRELSHKGALAGALRASLKDKERRFLEELKRRSHKITALNGELQRQTDAAARLSFQLYAAQQSLQEQEGRARRGCERLATPPPPPPPAAAAAKPKHRRSHRPAALVRAERARECVPRERVSGPEEPAPMPDPALFLYPRRHRPRPRSAHAHRPHRGPAAARSIGGEDTEEGESSLTDHAPTSTTTAAAEAE